MDIEILINDFNKSKARKVQHLYFFPNVRKDTFNRGIFILHFCSLIFRNNVL